MKPNFALILSFEGIRLLHRVQTGWHLVGETALDVPDLGVALADMRADALLLAPSGLLCKIVIPNDQIKYLTIQTGILPDEVMREQRVALALDGATPYDVHDLAFDWTVVGENTHIAAVARETLDEAEGFALEYGFTPVSFVAIPEPLEFPGEPFLGMAPSARDSLGPSATVARDSEAIRVTGTAEIPRAEPEPESDPAPNAEPQITDVAEPQVTDEAEPEIVAEADPAPQDPEPIPYKDPEPSPEPAPQPPASDPVPEPEPDTPEPEQPDPDLPEPAQPEPAPEELPAPDLPSPQAPEETPQPDLPDDLPPAAPEEVPASPDHTPEDVPQPATDPDLPPAGDPPLEIPSFRAARSGDGAALRPQSKASTDSPDSPDKPILPPAPATGEATQSGPVSFQSMRARRGDTPAAAGKLAGARRDAGFDGAGFTAPSIPIEQDDLPEPLAEFTAVAQAEAATDTEDGGKLPPAPAPLAQTLRQQPAPVITDVAAKPKPAGAPSQTSLAAKLAPLASAASNVLARRLKPAAKPAATEANAPKRTGFKLKKAARTPTDPKSAARQRAANERQRMTVFGARRPEPDAVVIGGKPRYLGLVLTAVLLLFLAGMAAFAAIAPEKVSALFGFGRDTPAYAELPGDMEDTALAEGDEATPEGHVDLAMYSDPDDRPGYGEATGLSAPGLTPLSPEEVAARYAATGIWQAAPSRPDAPGEIPLDDLYQTSIDPKLTLQDAIALPDPRGISPDAAQRGQLNPMAAGTVTPFDARGLVKATPEGTLSPEGFTVFAGPPPRKPPQTPTRFAEDPVATTGPADLRLAVIRPRSRPGDLVEQNERTQFGGLTRNELASIRPRLRPESAQEQALAAAQATARAEADAARAASLANAVEGAVQEAVTNPATPPDPTASGTRLAVATSLKPKDRPGNFARIVDRARKAQETAPAVRTAAAATIKPRTVAPSVPSKANVAKQATMKNAINLRQVNLIGVYGKPSSRRALVRLANGRYQKVSVGDRVDGGRVVAISDSELRYQKNGRNVTLKMPKG